MMNRTNAYEVIVCLGRALLPGGKAAPILLTRCNKAAGLQQDKGCLIINTGGDPAHVGITEARVMSEHMVNVKEIDQDNIIEETESQTTVGNAAFVLKILKDLNQGEKDGPLSGIKTLYLVTSPHHMVRSSYTFKAVFEHLSLIHI